MARKARRGPATHDLDARGHDEGVRGIATKADIRRIALALDGVSEVDHWHRPSWRTKKRVFAVLRPDGLNLHVPDERKEFLFAAAPDIFVKQMWGKRSYMVVQYGKVPKAELTALLREAWEHAAPPPPKTKKPARKR